MPLLQSLQQTASILQYTLSDRNNVVNIGKTAAVMLVGYVITTVSF